MLKASGFPVEFEVHFLSEIHAALSENVDEVSESIERNGVCLMAALTTPEIGDHGDLQSVNMKLRKNLDLFASVVRVKNVPGVATRHQGEKL